MNLESSLLINKMLQLALLLISQFGDLVNVSAQGN